MSREAMQMALWTLEGWANHDNWVWPESALEQAKRNTIEAITALRQALVDADDISEERVDETVKIEHEPVAWASSLDFDDDDIEIISAKAKGKLGTSNCDIPLYAAPPKQWVGLTLLEIEKCIYDANDDPIVACRNVEAKLRERNHG